LKSRLPTGVTGLLYLGVYAAGRFFLSFLRTDPSIFLGLRQAQLASLAMVVFAVAGAALLAWRARTAAEPAVTATV
jgi:phosphatidylglycerol:prolipoprotein diacylglycerol transferase